MITGTVKFFNRLKGFGFIAGEDGKDYYVHAKALIDKIKDGDKVTFDTAESEKGLNAENVKRVPE